MVKIYSEVICRNIPVEDLDLDPASRQLVVAEHSGRVHSFQLSSDCKLWLDQFFFISTQGLDHLEPRWVTDMSPTDIVRVVRLSNKGAVHTYVLNTGKWYVIVLTKPTRSDVPLPVSFSMALLANGQMRNDLLLRRTQFFF